MTQILSPETIADGITSMTPGQKRRLLPPAILLGGGANALSAARNIGRLGAAVYALNEPGAFVRYSRYCRPIDLPNQPGRSDADAWIDFLLGPESDHLAGAVLLSCADAGIVCLCAHREQLAAKYRLDSCNPTAQMAMLNKLETYRQAVEAGVPTPKFWVLDSLEQLEEICGALSYPLIVKPRLSHVFEGMTGKKLITARDIAEARAAVAMVVGSGAGCLLMEMIPGPDDRLCSYFTYLDEQGRPLLDFTKRIIRRFPALTGTACYHITDWNPEAAELGKKLFRHVRLRGVANVEFKRDIRDGKLKLIECNARLTASDCLVTRSGVDLAAFVYRRLAGLPQPPMEPYRRGLRLWDPVRDFQAHLELRRDGQSSFWRWATSVLHRQTLPYFQWSDPLPALARASAPLRRKWLGKS